MRLDVSIRLLGGGVLCAIAQASFVPAALAQEALRPLGPIWASDPALQLSPTGSAESPDPFFGDAPLQRLMGEGFTPEINDTRTFGVTRRSDDGIIEQFRVRTTQTVSPIPEAARLGQDDIDVRYTRGWALRSGQADGVQVEFTPHAGVGIGTDGGSAEAGATVRIGRLEVRDGVSYDEDQGRWYLFAAGSGTAVGLNWVRGADGWGRQLTHDSGSFIGDAQVGVAWRRGDTQASFGYVHREVTAEGVHGGTGIDRDATEGFVAFQFSLRPDW